MGIILLGFDTHEITQADLEAMRSIAPDKQPLISKDPAQIEAVLDEIEIVVGHFPLNLLNRLLRGQSFRWYQQWGAGADWLMESPQGVGDDFLLTNASGVHSIPISEHILALLLALARRLPQAIRMQVDRRWKDGSGEDVFELAGKTMLLIGTGAIGARTARLAQAFDMRVLGIRRNPDESLEGVEAMYAPEQLLELLPQADFVVLTIPLTPETEGMIGKPELQAMKPSAYIVNIGRGGTIREAALVQALQEGWIAGAGLDVFEKEPLPAGSPLWEMENVIVTAHYAGSTPSYHERAMAIFLDNLRRYVTGEPLRNVVDKDLGY